ncbi:MAG TPA: hypothetical protein VGP68_23305 [Gemmataceae bacterium]|jgi:hypothetical protein|nr:hypothetical protein [Gemmataceae bacterium]
MNAPLQNVIHSAVVRIQLTVNGHVLNVAQLGPDFLVLRNPIEHPPANAEVFVSIDGNEKRWPVYLADGIKTSERKTRITDLVIPK